MTGWITAINKKGALGFYVVPEVVATSNKNNEYHYGSVLNEKRIDTQAGSWH